MVYSACRQATTTPSIILIIILNYSYRNTDYHEELIERSVSFCSNNSITDTHDWSSDFNNIDEKDDGNYHLKHVYSSHD